MRDPAGVEIERIDIGNSPGAVDDAVGLDKALRAAALIDDTQAVADRLDALRLDTGVQRDADALAFADELADRILIQVLEEPRQCLEDGHLGTRARIDMAELERNHAATDEQHIATQLD